MSEYRKLLVGINGDTPLGYVVQTRAETDPKKIKEMTAHQKKIRSEWLEFKNKMKKKNEMNNKIILTGDDITKVMSKLFG